MYRQNAEVLFEKFNSSKEGLTSKEASERLLKNGRNEIVSEKKISVFYIFFSSFKDIMIIILFFAAILSVVLQEYLNAIMIGLIVFLNSIIATVQEVKANQAVNSLKDLSAPKCLVKRDGIKEYIDARELVEGDIVLIEAGNIIPADGRIVQSSNLRIDESILTGESLPIDKDASFLADDNIALSDRKNMVYSSTKVIFGRGEYIVTQTAMDTEIGKIAFMIMQEEVTKTPLQNKLDDVGKTLASIILFLSLLIFGLGVYQGREIFEMLFISITLSVAAIPEGLPTIVSIVLSLGVSRLAKKNAIVKGLSSIETLGGANVICSDKTGTITENKMKVEVTYSKNEEELIKGIVLCNDSIINKNGKEIGEPTELALINYAIENEIDLEKLYETNRRVNEYPFESSRKMMSTLHSSDSGELVQYTKGALDVILDKCNKFLDGDKVVDINEEIKSEIISESDKYTSDAMRVLALAMRTATEIKEEELTFVGFVAMIDPPREESKVSVRECISAGIDVVMITGDHLNTAISIAKKINLFDENKHIAMTGLELKSLTDQELNEKIEDIRVFARVEPAQKVRIVKAWQNKNKIVAMTGDGVNDAPAIKRAEIGIAMGKNGTDVSREAADMVLADDNFATIVTAVKEGRGIYDNIKKTIRYLLSCNFGEILVITVIMLLGLPMPLTPIHILWINLISDGLPAVALGVESNDIGVMQRAPRDVNKGIFNKKNITFTFFEGIIIGGLSLVAFYIGYQTNIKTAMTMTFLTLAFSQLVHAINIRSNDTIFVKGLFTNKVFNYTFIISVILQLLIMFLPFIRNIFGLVQIDAMNWLVITGLSILPFIIMEIRKQIVR